MGGKSALVQAQVLAQQHGGQCGWAASARRKAAGSPAGRVWSAAHCEPARGRESQPGLPCAWPAVVRWCSHPASAVQPPCRRQCLDKEAGGVGWGGVGSGGGGGWGAEHTAADRLQTARRAAARPPARRAPRQAAAPHSRLPHRACPPWCPPPGPPRQRRPAARAPMWWSRCRRCQAGAETPGGAPLAPGRQRPPVRRRRSSRSPAGRVQSAGWGMEEQGEMECRSTDGAHARAAQLHALVDA